MKRNRMGLNSGSLRSSLFAAVFMGLGSVASYAQTFEERLPLCLTCHGEKGQSEIADTPSLGGQPSMYVMIELYMFRQNLRIAPPMNDMAAGLSDADLQRFADTIAKLPPPAPAEGGDPARMERARALAGQHRCGFCHGNTFAGSENVPRLAGQREDYLLKALREYKANKRAEYQPVMAEVIVPLKDEDFVDLAYFLARAR
jgi:cytochrome c553